MNGAALTPLRGEMQVIFQDPYSSLNPAHDRRRHHHRARGSSTTCYEDHAERAKKLAKLLDVCGIAQEPPASAIPTNSPAASASASASRARWPSTRS